MICANCQSEIADTSKFCRKCGALVSAAANKERTKFCPSCGTENAASAKFCKADGFRFAIPAESARLPAEAAEIEPTVRSTPQQQQPESTPTNAAPAWGSTVTQAMPAPAPTAAPPFAPAPAPAQPAYVAGPRTAPSEPLHPTAPHTDPPAFTQATVAPMREGRRASSKPSHGLLVGVAALLVVIGGGGGYWYFLDDGQKPVQVMAITPAAPMAPPVQAPPPSAPVASETPLAAVPAPPIPDPAKLAPMVKQALVESGFPTLDVHTGSNLAVTLKGTLANEQAKGKAIAVALSVRGVEAVGDEIQVDPQAVPLPAVPPPASAKTGPVETLVPPASPGSDTRAAMARDLAAKLRAAGLGGVSPKVGPDLAIKLTGSVTSAHEKNEAIRLALAAPGANRIEENLRITAPVAPPTLPTASANAPPMQQVDPAKLEGEVNRALRNAGVGGVTSQVADDLSLTLKGSGSATQKETAMRIARNFKGVKRVRDQVFVVEQ